ncbi:MAG: hypothetical protein AB1489_38875, partial [Acidobacteriota bacterium]
MENTLTASELVSASLHIKDESKEGWQMATLVSDNLAIAMATHLLAMPPTEGSTQELELSFPHWPSPWKTAVTPIYNNRELGVIVLKLSHPSPFKIPYLLSDQRPQNEVEWESFYIPASEPAMSLHGINMTRDRQKFLELLVVEMPSYASPGMSGAPVIINNKIVGILSTLSTDTMNLWYAIPGNLLKPFVDKLIFPESSLVAEKPYEKAQDVPSNDQINESVLFQRLSTASLRTLNYADGIRDTLNKNRLHMEYLLAGILEEQGGPAQQLILQ